MSAGYQGVTPYTIFTTTTVTASAFPIATLVSTFSYPTGNLGLIGFQMSTGIITAGASPAGAFLVVNRNDPTITVGQSSGILCTHMVGPSAALATNAFLPFSDTMSFNGAGIRIPAGQPISIYVACDNFGGTTVFSSCSLYTIPVE